MRCCFASTGPGLAKPRRCCVLRAAAFSPHPLLPVLCTPWSERAGCTASPSLLHLPLQKLVLQTHLSYLGWNTNQWHCSHRIYGILYFISHLDWGERKEKVEKALSFSFWETIQDPLAVKNSPGLSLPGGAESEDSGISAMKCPRWAHTEAPLHSLDGIWAHWWCQVRKEDPHGNGMYVYVLKSCWSALSLFLSTSSSGWHGNDMEIDFCMCFVRLCWISSSHGKL